MKYAFFSDVHSNNAALDKLSGHPDFQSADQKICLGDTFDAHETETAKAMFEKAVPLSDVMLLGNHEAVIAGKCDEAVFSQKVRQRVLEAKELLGRDEAFISKLTALPEDYSVAGIQAAHASFDPANRWTHVRYIEDLEAQSPFMKEHLNILGHGHIPFVAWKKNNLWYYQRFVYNEPFVLEQDTQYLINVGSILGSRELRELERTFVTYDDETSELKFFNLEAA